MQAHPERICLFQKMCQAHKKPKRYCDNRSKPDPGYPHDAAEDDRQNNVGRCLYDSHHNGTILIPVGKDRLHHHFRHRHYQELKTNPAVVFAR